MLPPQGRRLSASVRRQFAALLLVIALLTVPFHFPQRFASIIPTAQAASTSVVISEFRVRGPNGAADEFIELYNLTDSPINIGGWKINGSNSTGGVSTRVTIAAGTIIPARGHFLATNSSASGGPYSGSVPGNQTYATGITDEGGIALLTPTDVVVDAVGTHTGSAYQEGTVLATLGTTTAANLNRCYERKPGGTAGSTQDTDNNVSDFQVRQPCDPQNLSSAPTPAPSPVTSAGALQFSAASYSIAENGGSVSITVSRTGGSDGSVSVNYATSDGTATSGTDYMPASDTLTFGDGETSQSFNIQVIDDLLFDGDETVNLTLSTPTGGATLGSQTTATLTIIEDDVAPPPTPAPAGAVVISQVYGGGGNSGATYTHDFIEIFNRSSETVTLTNWSVQYSSATGSSWSNRTDFSATLAPGQYFLIRGAAGAGAGVALPTPDVIGNINLSGTTGKVALVNNTTALTGTCPTGDSSVMDFVGYGTSANCAEGDDEAAGDNAAPQLSNTSAAIRVDDGCADTGSNAADFTASTPTPRNSGSTPKNCDEPPPPPNESNSTVVISQVYAGGGNSGAVYTNDYVELYNRGTTTVNLGGWSLQYASATGSGWDFTKQPLGGTIAPGEYYLVSLASGGANGISLPQANIAGEINMSATAGKIALVRNFDSLEGVCPLSDPDLADFVGYGSTASCGEGNKKASSPGTANALLRRNGGLTDTDDNQADFTTGTPNPRRTAPIVEIGPYVFSTDPRSNTTTAPRDASIIVNFTEPVEVTGQWFNIQCATTGAHNSATIAGGPKTYTITPNVSFINGEQCTVTIYRDSVRDLDTDDSGPDTDTLTADYTWTFTTSTGAPPPYPPDVHLTLGNPSAADFSDPNNYLMEKPEFALSYNRDRGTPNWVSWHLSDDWVGSLARFDTFRPDPAVPSDWYRVLGTDYSGSGFDRGHMVPNADRDHQDSMPINQATFLMTNIVPQSPDNNQGPWAAQENYLRTLLPANEIYIIAGGVGEGGTGSGGFMTTIANGRVSVPSHTWKVVLVIPKAAGDDIARVTASTRTIAVIMPNTQGIRNNDWQSYLVSVDQVEAMTGYDFFSNLPDAIENSIEAGINGNNPPGTENQSVITNEDTPTEITLSAVSPNNNPLTYTVLTQPAHGTLTGTGANRVYTPTANFHGTDSFTYRVNDGQSNSNTATVSITVLSVNDAPVLTNVPATATINELSAYTFTASASDVDGDALTFSLVNAPEGATINPVTGQFSWTPTIAQIGAVYTFSVRVTDDGSGNLYAQEQISIGVAYTWSGVLQPINPDGSSIFNQGSTIPVKFRLTGASAGITNATVRLLIAKITDGVVGTEIEAVSTAASTTGNLFRYDSSSGQYIFNLRTRELTPGTYRLRIDMGDGVMRVVTISLKD